MFGGLGVVACCVYSDLLLFVCWLLYVVCFLLSGCSVVFLFIIGCRLLLVVFVVAYRWLFVLCCLLIVGRYVVVAICFVVCCLPCVVCRLLCVVCCVLCVVCCL